MPLCDPLRYINAYLIEDDDGYAVVDCGWELPEVRSALDAALLELRIPVSRIGKLVITHFHSDHYGQTGTLAERSGARVFMHGEEWRILDEHWRDIPREMRRRDAWLVRNGYREPVFQNGHTAILTWFTMRAPDERLSDGDVVRIGGRRFQVVWTPGHTPGHICLYDAERREILTGDHIIPDTTAFISDWNLPEASPLDAFRASLRKVAALGARTALPAHREPIADVQARIAEILASAEARESLVVGALAEDDAWLTAAQVAARAFFPAAENSDTTTCRSFKPAFGISDTIAYFCVPWSFRDAPYCVDDGVLIRYRLTAKPVRESSARCRDHEGCSQGSPPSSAGGFGS